MEKQNSEIIKTLSNLKLDKIPNKIPMEESKRPISYSDILKESVVVVKPTKACQSSVTKNMIKQKINPVELGIGIKNMKDAREGSVVISCKNREDANKLRTSLEPKMGKNFITSVPNKKNPRIKIVGLEDQYTEEKLIKTLRIQNPELIKAESNIKLIVCKKMVKTHFAIIECDANTFKRVISQADNRLYLDCRACRFFEYVGVFRCYNCNQYNHTSKECKEVKSCAFCASKDHETKDCGKEKLECINCKVSNEKFDTNFSTCHGAYDVECPTFIRLQDKERSKIGYCENDEI